jgi:tRNA-dihydrouridine synthase B
MISSKAMHYEDESTKKLLDTDGEKKPISMQIFGSDPSIMKEAAITLQEKTSIIDINMGCPAPKVVKNGDGSKLLLNLNLVEEILREVVKEAKVPVTVKIRTGWDKDNIVAVEAAKIAENAGVSAIAVHGRTRQEYYSGAVNLNLIKQVKESVNIPVIGNGDIKNAKDAIRMFEYTGVDGIMIGRAALGNPWIIGQIRDGLLGNEVYTPSLEEKLSVIKEHLNMAIEYKGEYIGLREMRKHMSWYVKGMKDSSIVRDRINKLETKEEVLECLNEYFTSSTSILKLVEKN